MCVTRTLKSQVATVNLNEGRAKRPWRLFLMQCQLWPAKPNNHSRVSTQGVGAGKTGQNPFSVLGGGQVLLEKQYWGRRIWAWSSCWKIPAFLENSMTKIRIPSNPHLNHALTAFANWLGKQIWKTNMPDSPMQINGYTIYEHECFTRQLDRLVLR